MTTTQKCIHGNYILHCVYGRRQVGIGRFAYLRRGNRNAHVNEIMVDQIRPINTGIHRRDFLQGRRRRRHKGAHKAKLDVMLF